MKITRCENDLHYYDADLYEGCPHCRKEQADGAQNIRNLPKQVPGAAPFIPIQEPAPAMPAVQSIPMQNQESPKTIFCTSCGKAQSAAKQFCTQCGARLRIPVVSPEQGSQSQVLPQIKTPDENHTSSIWEQQSGKAAEIVDEIVQFMPIEPDVNATHVTVTEHHEPRAVQNPSEAEYQPLQPEHPMQQPVITESAQDTMNAEEDLKKAVAAVTSHGASEDAKTVAFYDFGTEASPVVGWLVCVQGEYQGQGFDIKSGQNYIGRAQNMNIALAREASVSRNRHAGIIFDPSKSIFHIQQGESSGLTYLNGELVMEHTQLSAYDKIKIGNAEFVFVPFCNDKFSWDEYIER